MRPIDFPEANAYYEKPKSMTDEECMPVSAFQRKDENGEVVQITTVWLPNKEDLEAMIAGRPICISITGSALPPHAVWTYNENGKINE